MADDNYKIPREIYRETKEAGLPGMAYAAILRNRGAGREPCARWQMRYGCHTPPCNWLHALHEHGMDALFRKKTPPSAKPILDAEKFKI